MLWQSGINRNIIHSRYAIFCRPGKRRARPESPRRIARNRLDFAPVCDIPAPTTFANRSLTMGIDKQSDLAANIQIGPIGRASCRERVYVLV